MKLKPTQTLKSLADLLGASFTGDANHPVTGINEIHRVEAGDLVFCDHPKYYDKALESAAGTVLINAEVDCPEGKGIIVSDDPFRDFNRLTRHFSPARLNTSLIAADAEIGEGCHISPNATVGSGVILGRDCVIHSGAVIHAGCTLGDRVIVHANSIIGGDGFYYKNRESGFDKMHSCGTVVLEDDVEIGGLCTIDRGVTADTRIGAGSKLDNQVHVGHDTVLGRKCLVAAQVGIAGCVVIEDEVTLWGQVGIPSDVTIGKGATILGQSGVTKSLKGGQTYFGSPAEEVREKYREMAAMRRLIRKG